LVPDHWASWQPDLEGFEMFTESEVVNEWIRQGMAKGMLEVSRQSLLEVLTIRFPEAVTDEIVRLINEQDNLDLLHDWFKATVRARTFEQLPNMLKK
jgi:hypothetical protein